MIQALIGPVTGLLDKFIEDKDQKNKLAHEIATMAEKQMHEQVMGQLEVNKAEAQHRSIFVAGWRPFIGWVCGLALLYNFVIRALVAWVNPTVIPPALQMDQLITILLGMLGLCGFRTSDKLKDQSK